MATITLIVMLFGGTNAALASDPPIIIIGPQGAVADLLIERGEEVCVEAKVPATFYDEVVGVAAAFTLEVMVPFCYDGTNVTQWDHDWEFRVHVPIYRFGGSQESYPSSAPDTSKTYYVQVHARYCPVVCDPTGDRDVWVDVTIYGTGDVEASAGEL